MDEDIVNNEDYEDVAVIVHGVLAPEGVRTRDGRRFKDGAIWWNRLPLPLLYQDKTADGHDASVRTGKIEEIIRKDGLLYWQGSLLDTDFTDRVGQEIAEEVADGISVDLFDVITQIEDADGNVVDEDYVMSESTDTSKFETVFTEGELGGATIVAFPAFREAYIALGPLDAELRSVEPGDDTEEELASLAASAAEEIDDFAPGTQDGPGWLTHPIPTDRLRDYWTKGPGAAKIGWGTPGDFRRCRALLAPYVKPQHLSGYCANRHYDALKTWPGRHSARTDTYDAAEPYMLVASGVPIRPPAAWFEDPKLVGPSPLTVTEDGRVFGHVATWETCHIAYSGSCITPPHSRTDYSHFCTGSVLTEEGKTLRVGKLTIGTGHADAKLNAAAAAAHYDDTGTAAALVEAGEDQYGIWVAGAVTPWATAEQVAQLRAAPLSGDWRTVGGSLEMVAALGVNVGGFPIPRSRETAEGTYALVAAGVVPRGEFAAQDFSDTIAQAVQEEIDRREAQAAASRRMAELRTKVNKKKLDKIKERRG